MCTKQFLLVALILAAVGQISHAGLVAYWDLEEGSGTTTTAALGSPQADGTLVGATWITEGLAPIHGTAAAAFFTSTSASRIETTHPGVVGQAARSVTAWVKPEPTQTNNGVMVGWGANVNDQRYSFRINKTAADGVVNALRLEIQGSRVVATTPVNDGQWHHIVVAHGAGARIGEVSFYVDGQPDAVSGTAGGGLINTASTSVVLGNSGHATATYGFDGALDEVRIYDHVLTQAEIQEIMKGASPGRASGPNPVHGAVDVPADVTLNWTAGQYAAGHDVYVGTVFADVNDAGRTDPMGVLARQGQPDAQYDPAGLLEYGKTYYWRVDEVNAAPDNTIFKGETWSFTVEPFAYPVQPVAATASSAQPDMGPENTINQSGLNAQDEHSTELMQMWTSAGTGANWIQYEFDKVYKLDSLLVWNSNQMIEPFLGFGAKSVTIECSADGQTWTALEGVPEFAQATGKPTYTANTTVDLGGVMAKFVKLTINSNWGGVTPQAGLSEVRFFYVPLQARAPMPADGAANVRLEAELNWRSGREATSHQVFLGTDANAVADGAVAGQSVAEHSYTPAALDFGTKYFWKVDEVGDAGTYPGELWNFATQEYAVVDDMESYNDDDHRIYQAWVDGVTTGLSGSTVGYFQAPFAERTIVHGGKQAMPFEYNNVSTPFFSEAEQEFAIGQNWTVNGADTLSLWVRGNPAPFAEEAGVITMSAAGHDIWDNADDFRFAFKTLSGDGSVVVKVESLVNTNAWAKAGVMIRQSLDADSAFVYFIQSFAQGVSLGWRPTTAATCGSATQAGIMAPQWVKLIRKGDVFTAQYSADGKTWTDVTNADGTVASTTVAMTGPVYVGLCVTSHNAAATTTAVMSGAATTGNVTGGSWQVQAIGDDPQPANAAADLYVTVQDSASKKATAVNPTAVTTAAWTQWKVPLTSFTGVNLKVVKKLVVGVDSRTSPSKGGGMIFVDDIGFGHPLP